MHPRRAAKPKQARASTSTKLAHSSSMNLLDLPEHCLLQIAKSMDRGTKRQFFRTSKGSKEKLGCATLVLEASDLTFTYWSHRPPLSDTTRHLLHWAGQICKEVHLRLCCIDEDLNDVLHKLLLFPNAKATRSGNAHGNPKTYPGVTHLFLHGCQATALIPKAVATAFPNLRCLVTDCNGDPDEMPQEWGPVLTRGLPNIQHVSVSPDNYVSLYTVQHIAQQLRHLPSLTSLHTNDTLSEMLDDTTLRRLKNLQLSVEDQPSVHDFRDVIELWCPNLECLCMYGHWLNVVRPHKLEFPDTIQELRIPMRLTDECLSYLVELPNLSVLEVGRIVTLSGDYSSNTACKWKRLAFQQGGSSRITKLPLHGLEHPVECTFFTLYVSSDYEADLAAIKAAKPHLVRCGGIKFEDDTDEKLINLVMAEDAFITKQQATKLLEEWAACLPADLEQVSCPSRAVRLIKAAVARLWPEAELATDTTQYQTSDDESVGGDNSDDELILW